jgi:hypothetical protein
MQLAVGITSGKFNKIIGKQRAGNNQRFIKSRTVKGMKLVSPRKIYF